MDAAEKDETYILLCRFKTNILNYKEKDFFKRSRSLMTLQMLEKNNRHF